MPRTLCSLLSNAAAAGVCALVSSCDSGPGVVVYASVDRQLAEPVLEAFRAQSHITPRAVFDIESNKTVGLVNRLVAERSNPRADVFWNGEFARTIELCEEGVLARSHQSPSSALDDPQGCWYALSARLRVLLVQRKLHAQGAEVHSLAALRMPQWRGRTCVASPRFGTTSTHFAALLTAWGEDSFRRWLRDLRANEVVVLPGNAQVKESVVRGSCQVGLTDTDDALAAIAEGAAVELVIPDQRPEGTGAFMIPSTVALVADAPAKARAQRMIEFLLSDRAEGLLVQGPGGFIPVRHSMPARAPLPAISELKLMKVDLGAVARSVPAMLRIVDEEWPR